MLKIVLQVAGKQHHMETYLHKGIKSAVSNKYVGKCKNNNVGLILFSILPVVKTT